MNKVVKIIQILAFCISGFEILAFGIFISLYLANIRELQTILSIETIAYIAIGVVVLNLISIGVYIFLIAHFKQKNDLLTSRIVGQASGEAYIFAKLGFIVIDDKNQVIWASELFNQLDLNLIGENVFEWKEELKEFLDTSKNIESKTIKINDNFYEVKYLKSNQLFLFRDVTDFENALILFQKNSLALGIIMIDNYTDIAQNNEDINDVIPQVRTAISNYAKQYHLVLRAYKNDSYFVVGRNEDIDLMKKDNFSILNQVRQIGQKYDVSTSLSIGFGYDYSSTSQINEMASNALGIAMSRGGDQAVVAQMNKELYFAGGKIEASETRNKVKVKNDANTILNLIEDNKNNKIFIMGHANADMDAIGSCLAMKAICDYKQCSDVKIVYDPKSTEKKARGALMAMYSRDELEKWTINLKDAINECDQTSLLIIVDVNRPQIMMCPELLERTEKIIIIDHHRRSSDFVENLLFGIIDTSASSASELITEIIKFGSKYPPIPLDSRTATVMLSGIFLDTSFYKSKTVGVRTFEASMVLKEYGADNFKADNLLKDEFEEYSLISSIVSTQITAYQGVVYCKCNDIDIIDQATLAKAANQCMDLKNTKAAFVIGRTGENDVRISARSDGTINVQLICEKFGGGGHFTMAAALFKDMSVDDVEKILLSTLATSLDDGRVSQQNGKG